MVIGLTGILELGVTISCEDLLDKFIFRLRTTTVTAIIVNITRIKDLIFIKPPLLITESYSTLITAIIHAKAHRSMIIIAINTILTIRTTNIPICIPILFNIARS